MKAWLAQHREAFASAVRRLVGAPLNTLLSVAAIGIALALPAAGLMIMSNAQALFHSAASTPQLSVFMALDADAGQTRAVETRLRTDPQIRAVRFVPRDQTLARMKSNAGLGEVIDALQTNPFPDAFVAEPGDAQAEAMEKVAADLRALPGVEHVQLDAAWARRLDALLRLGRNALLLLAALLAAGLVAITFNTIRLQVLTRRDEIELCHLLGASDSFIGRPFYYFGLLQGLLGGVAAWLIVAAATRALREPVAQLAQLYALNVSLASLDGIESALLLGAAALLGWLGAVLSLQQYLRRA